MGNLQEPHLSLSRVYHAKADTAPYCMHTPMIHSVSLSSLTGSPVFLKLEILQATGTFKIRGATNKLFRLQPQERVRGVVTASTGNHGRAVAYVAGKMGVRATVCISKDVPPNKVAGIRALGAKVDIYGASQDEAFVRSAQHQEQSGKIMVHPFDDLDIIAGQGTIALELVEDLPNLDLAIIPLSGGGLISGIAFVLKVINPSIRVVGVSMEHAPVMYHSLKAGKPIEISEEDTLADSLRGGIGLENRYTFHMVQDLVDDVVLVSEEEIARAMAFLLTEHQLVVEGAGAVGVAALISEKISGGEKNTAVLLSGKNIDSRTYLKAVQAYIDWRS
jgi:threonine dehydratase